MLKIIPNFSCDFISQRYGLNEFQFTKLIKCGNCGGEITAEEKIKRLPNGSQKKYVYYHCTRHVDTNCQEPYIREENCLIRLLGLQIN